MKRAPLSAALLLGALLLLLFAPAPARAGAPPRSVLLFLADDSTTPAMSAITAGLRSAVHGGWDGPVSFGLEHLDLGWFQSPAYEQQLRSFYRVKYRGFRPDVIVALRLDAIKILLEIRRELWPGVPLVFFAEDPQPVAGLVAEPDVTGLWIHFEARHTVESALALLPGTRRVALVVGSSPWESAERARFREEIGQLGDRVEILDTSGLPFAELEQRLRTLPADAVVLFHSYYVDGAGQRFVGLNAFERLRPVVPRPVFTVHLLGLGVGVVGGVMIDYTRLGRDLGSVTLRVLRGERAASIPARAADASVTAFDARELARFGIPEDRVPPGAEIRFREPSFWERYRWHATAALAGITLQAALIAVLLIERRRRARAQAQLRERLQIEHLVATISSGFANLPASRIDAQIEHSLRLAGELLGVDRCVLWRLAQDGRRIVAAAAWHAEGAGASEPSIAAADLSVQIERLVQGEVVFFSRLEDLSGDRRAGRATFERLGICSMVAVPVAVGGATIGVVTFASIRRERRFTAELAHGLRTLGEIFATVHQRRESEAAVAHLNRVSAVGELAFSLAHELNQPLAAILSTAQAAQRLRASDRLGAAELDEALADIVDADRRAGEVIRRMRALLKRGEATLERCDLNEVARGVARLVAADALLRGAEIALELAAEPPLVQGDVVQLQQVALNLMSNALDAVSAQQPGDRKVTVRTSGSGRMAELAVEDSGPGAADLDRIFDPFFTTKPAGLGMGLSICRTIAEAHVGRLSAERANSGGLLVRFVLPQD